MTKRLVSVDRVIGKPIDNSKQPCKFDFWSSFCCWIESNGCFVVECHKTCLDIGDGTFEQCKIYYYSFRKADVSSSTNEHDDNRVPNDDGVLTESQYLYGKNE